MEEEHGISKYGAEILERVVRIETKLDNFSRMNNEIDEIKKFENTCKLAVVQKLTEHGDSLAEHSAAIKELRDANKWIFRTAVGGLITSTIAIIFMLVLEGKLSR